MGYTLKLDLSDYEYTVLVTLLQTDAERSEREGTKGSFWATAVAGIREQIHGYGEAVKAARELP